MSVSEVAPRLDISAQAVRQMAVSKALSATKQAGVWWIDTRAVERRRRQPVGRGRPLSPSMAWSVLLLASDMAGGDALARHDHHSPRARQWLIDHSLAERAGSLRARAVREPFHAHPSELPRLLGSPDTMRSGLSAGELVGLHGGPAVAEVYAPASKREQLISEHALEPGDGAVLIRWVFDEIWPVIAADCAPRAAVFLDLLESDDPRSRREAMRALGR